MNKCCYEVLEDLAYSIREHGEFPQISLKEIEILTDSNSLRTLKFTYPFPQDFVQEEEPGYYLSRIINEPSINLYYVLALCIRLHPIVRKKVTAVIKAITYA